TGGTEIAPPSRLMASAVVLPPAVNSFMPASTPGNPSSQPLLASAGGDDSGTISSFTGHMLLPSESLSILASDTAPVPSIPAGPDSSSSGQSFIPDGSTPSSSETSLATAASAHRTHPMVLSSDSLSAVADVSSDDLMLGQHTFDAVTPDDPETHL